MDVEPRMFTEAEVEALIAAATAPLLAKIKELELRIARMQRDSSTSSKPPSSDITKPPQGGPSGGGGKKRKPGGQQGHTKHERKRFKPDEIDTAWLYTFVDEDGLEPIAEDDPDEDAWRVVQQVEWRRRSLRLIEHRAQRDRRIDSGRIVVAPLPEVKRVLGKKHAGTVVCDDDGVYRKCLDDMAGLRVQFCWSHLIREFKFLLTLPSAVAQKYGGRVLKIVRRMFGLWHRRADLSPGHYERSMRRLKTGILKAAKSKSNHDEVRKLAKRLSSRFAESYFTFIDYLHLPGVEPTNNRTERQIRFVVIDRKVTQGTKAEVGKRWCQCIWTTLATRRQQGKQIYHFLVESIEFKLGNRRCQPSLIY